MFVRNVFCLCSPLLQNLIVFGIQPKNESESRSARILRVILYFLLDFAPIRLLVLQLQTRHFSKIISKIRPLVCS